MRRFSILVLAIAVFPTPPAPASAQQMIAVWSGVNATWREDGSFPHKPQDLNPLRRISVGATATFPTGSWFAVQLGAGYSRRGSVVVHTPDSLETTWEADYLDLTMLGRLGYALVGNRLDLHLLAGPFLAFPVSSCLRTVVEGKPYESCGFLPPIDLGMAVGGGMDLRLTGRFDVTMGLLYNYRLLYCDGFQIGHIGTGQSLRALALRVGLAYNIH
jgi:hypothetical protein